MSVETLNLLCTTIRNIAKEYCPNPQIETEGVLVQLMEIEKVIQNLLYENKENNKIIERILLAHSNVFKSFKEQMTNELIPANTELEPRIPRNYWPRY